MSIHHAQVRGMERHGVALTLTDLINMRREIVTGAAERLYPVPGDCTVYRLEYRGEVWHPLYNPRSERVITLLSGRQVRRDQARLRRLARRREGA